MANNSLKPFQNLNRKINSQNTGQDLYEADLKQRTPWVK